MNLTTYQLSNPIPEQFIIGDKQYQYENTIKYVTHSKYLTRSLNEYFSSIFTEFQTKNLISSYNGGIYGFNVIDFESTDKIKITLSPGTLVIDSTFLKINNNIEFELPLDDNFNIILIAVEFNYLTDKKCKFNMYLYDSVNKILNDDGFLTNKFFIFKTFNLIKCLGDSQQYTLNNYTDLKINIKNKIYFSKFRYLFREHYRDISSNHQGAIDPLLIDSIEHDLNFEAD